MTKKLNPYRPFLDWLKKTMVDVGGYNYKKSQLAAEMEVAASEVSRWFAGEKPPAYEVIERLALWAGVMPPMIYDLLGMAVPETYDEGEFRFLVLYRRQNHDTRKRMIREMEELYGYRAENSGEGNGSSEAPVEKRKRRR